MQAMIDQLQHMKLTGLLEAWREQQALPTYHDLSFDERLALMVEREPTDAAPTPASSTAGARHP